MSITSKAVELSQAAKVRSQLRPHVAAPPAENPWEKDAPAEKISKNYQPRALDTCPWGPPSNDAQSIRSGKSRAPSHNTCPWGDGGLGDADSVAIQRAERHKQRAAPSQEGCAGIGAPRTEAPQRYPDSQQAQQDSYSSAAPEPVSSAFSPTYDSEEEAKERSALIEKCLMHGLGDEEIEGVLREHMFQKEAERQQRESEKSGTLKPDHLAPVSTSIAAQRQAKVKGSGKGSTQYGPTDEEVADMLYDNRAPIPSQGLRDRKKAEPTGKIGDLGATGCRNAYFDSKQVANAAKDRNRNGQGIF